MLLILSLVKPLLSLLLSLPLHLLDLLWRTVFNQLTLTAQPTPLRQPIWDVHDPLSIKHVAAGLEERFVFIRLQVDKRREQEDHIAALVHDGRVAVRAAHFAGELVLDGFLRRVVPLEVVVAVCEVDVGFVEDGGPSEGCGCVGLAPLST